MKKFLFVLLGIGVFAVSVLGGIGLGIWHITDSRYKYWKVNPAVDKGTVLKDLKYGPKPLNTYDLYLPADKGRKDYSLIFFVHGGGFTGGDKGATDAVRYGEYLASKGYVMASVNYSLISEEDPVGLTDMYEELVTAADAVVQKADELGYHIDEMAITGGSAGGTLAMLLAYKDPDTLPVPVRMVFEETGPASFEPELWSNADPESQAAFITFLSGKLFSPEDVGSEAFQQAIDEISPAAMITDQSVPILMAYGDQDQVVSVLAKFPLLEALEEHHIPHDYIEFPNSGHGLLSDPDQTKQYFDKMNEYLKKYLKDPGV